MLFFEHKESKKVVKAIAANDSKSVLTVDADGNEGEVETTLFANTYAKLQPQPEGFAPKLAVVEEKAEKKAK